MTSLSTYLPSYAPPKYAIRDLVRSHFHSDPMLIGARCSAESIFWSLLKNMSIYLDLPLRTLGAIDRRTIALLPSRLNHSLGIKGKGTWAQSTVAERPISPYLFTMTLANGTYAIHSSKAHYATSVGYGVPLIAHPPLTPGGPAVHQLWDVQQVQSGNSAEENVYIIHNPRLVQGRPNAGFGVSDRPVSEEHVFFTESTPFTITPKNEDKNIYVISPIPDVALNPEGGVKLAIIIERAPEGRVAIGGFPYNPDSQDVSALPGWVFTSINI
ncbi:hypothetical protein CPC08DRAFT_767924 [Agrocybe pediades]|nr:hypothetical protein CPC08DRAFT_767924 [Agrocybe pediades]